MAWSASAIFTQAVLNPLTASAWSTTEPTDPFTDRLNTLNNPVSWRWRANLSWRMGPYDAAIYANYTDSYINNSVTPDKDATVGSTGYNTGTWTTGNEVTDATNWVAGGRALGSKTYTASTGVVAFDAADTAGGGTVTISGAYGCLVYDATITAGTVAKQGLCFNYFGGSQSVTGGTFTIVWDASGVFKFTT